MALRPFGVDFFFIYYLTRLQSQKSKLWSFLAVRVLALSRPEVSASSYKQRTKRERGDRQDLRLSLAAESDSTLNGPLATYRRLVGDLKKHCGSTMTCRCFISARLQKTAPVLALLSENATR